MRTTSVILALSAALALNCGSSPEAPSGMSAGGRCAVLVKVQDGPVGTSGGQFRADITADTTCTWTGVSQVTWISGLTPSTGHGNQSVLFQVAANSGPARQGEILFNDTHLLIQQDGIDCTLVVDPQTQTIGPDITTGSVNVTTPAGCTWTASSNTSWLLVTAGASGNGNGAVAYRADANAGPTRTGVLTIGGVAVSITQTARPLSAGQ
jgi:hypothetical protein